VTRRELLLLLCGAITSARAARAQQKAMKVIGYLNGTSPDANAALLAAFRQGLSETGYVEGQNLVFEYRWAEFHYDRLPALAADLVGRKVDVLAACGGAGEAFVARSATSTIPIVVTTGADPVATGLVASLARPGGNLTGFTNLNTELWQKRVELISELVPRARLHIVLFGACSAFTRVAACILALSPNRDTLIEGFSHFVTSMTAPDCFRLERIAGWGLHPLESAALSRRTPIADTGSARRSCRGSGAVTDGGSHLLLVSKSRPRAVSL
jgi:hypothetical protein